MAIDQGTSLFIFDTNSCKLADGLAPVFVDGSMQKNYLTDFDWGKISNSRIAQAALEHLLANIYSNIYASNDLISMGCEDENNYNAFHLGIAKFTVLMNYYYENRMKETVPAEPFKEVMSRLAELYNVEVDIGGLNGEMPFDLAIAYPELLEDAVSAHAMSKSEKQLQMRIGVREESNELIYYFQDWGVGIDETVMGEMGKRADGTDFRNGITINTTGGNGKCLLAASAAKIGGRLDVYSGGNHLQIYGGEDNLLRSNLTSINECLSGTAFVITIPK